MMQPEERVLILAPMGRDAPVIAALLEAQGICTVICSEPGTCQRHMEAGAGALLLTEEALEMSGWAKLLDALPSQPTWSELPLIILTSGGESRRGSLLDLAASAAGSVILLERPMTSVTLLRSVQVALRSRRRQYRARDLIAEQHRAEEALREAHERLRYHLHNTPLAVIEFDAELRVRAWSGEAERVFGWAASEVIGRSMWDIPWTSEEDRSTLKTASARLGTGQTPRSVSLNRNVRKDGKTIWCEWYNSALSDAAGKLRSIQSLVLDVTERKTLQTELERLVAERTASLTDVVCELQHVSYAMVHDMRAPLRAMNGFAESLAEGLAESMTRAEALEYCRRIRSGATRLDKLITDAVKYTKAALVEMPTTPVALSELVQGLLDTYPNFHPTKADIRIEGELPVVLGSEALLTQCFSNLLGNAVKFVAPGVRPRVRLRSDQVTDQEVQEPRGEARVPSGMEHGTRPQQYKPPSPSALVRIWVEDNGIGIPPHAQKRLFGIFQKLDRQYEGTGVGLAIVRKVVERMGGRVGAESEPGKGSRFWVELPKAR